MRFGEATVLRRDVQFLLTFLNNSTPIIGDTGGQRWAIERPDMMRCDVAKIRSFYEYSPSWIGRHGDVDAKPKLRVVSSVTYATSRDLLTARGEIHMSAQIKGKSINTSFSNLML
jgi:hypothetical protein